MTPPIVVDASVAVKWFLVEPDSDRAVDLLDADELFAPALVAIEVAAAITRQFRVGAIDEQDAQRKLANARETLQRPIFNLIDDTDLLERASELAILLRHPLQDCLYLACAERLGAALLTVDPVFLKRAAAAFPLVRRF